MLKSQTNPAISANTMLRTLALCVMATILASSLAHVTVHAQTPSTTTVAGNVVNGTEGAQLPDGLEVFLLVIDEAQEAIIERISTTVDATGNFTVDAPSLAEGQFYRLVADDGIYTPYRDITDPTIQTNTSLTVFDRTTSLEQVAVESYGVVFPVISPAERTIAVLAAIALTNTGDEVYVADLADPALTGVKLLRFNLPEGYSALNVESDLPSGNVMEINTGFALSNPVPPGEWDLVVSYTATYDQNTFSYPFRLPFGATRVSFLLPEGQGELTGRGLSKGETVVLNDTTYVQYEGTNYERGSQLDVLITNLPSPGVSSQLFEFFGSAQFQIALAVTVGLLLAGSLAGFLMLRGPQTEARAASPILSDSTDRAEIIRQIATLDMQHEAGDISGADYIQQRRDLVNSAVDADD